MRVSPSQVSVCTWSLLSKCCGLFYRIVGLKVEVVHCSCAETAVHFSTVVSTGLQTLSRFSSYLKNVYWSEMCCERLFCVWGGLALVVCVAWFFSNVSSGDLNLVYKLCSFSMCGLVLQSTITLWRIGFRICHLLYFWCWNSYLRKLKEHDHGSRVFQEQRKRSVEVLGLPVKIPVNPELPVEWQDFRL